MITTVKAWFLRSNIEILSLRASFVVIFALFGTYKWFHFEAVGVSQLVAGTWLGTIYDILGMTPATYLLGVVENIALIFTVIGFFRPRFAVPGDLLLIITGITTLSLLPQLGRIDSFIIKDVFLISGGLILLKNDLLYK